MPDTHFVVLGGGLVGGFIARMLTEPDDARVTLVDVNQQTLDRIAATTTLSTLCADLSSTDAVRKAVADADIVVGAVPGSIGYATLEAVIGAGKPCVDISFFPEDARGLNSFAKEQGVPAVVDCGVMPGLGGMVAAQMAAELSTPERLSIMVGGLPTERNWPLEYRAPFSPADVIEEYTRPARMRVNGAMLTLPALSDIEHVDIPGVGTLEAFNTDGLRSLLHTLDIPTMIEKTLRYPGHAEKMRMLRQLGFLDDQPRDVNGQRIAPLSLTSQLLFDEWKLISGMTEFTAMRVEMSGVLDGAPSLRRCDLLDFTDSATGEFSMARTTGWPAILMARAIVANNYESLVGATGILFPENMARDSMLMQYMLTGLSGAGITLTFTTE